MQHAKKEERSRTISSAMAKDSRARAAYAAGTELERGDISTSLESRGNDVALFMRRSRNKARPTRLYRDPIAGGKRQQETAGGDGIGRHETHRSRNRPRGRAHRPTSSAAGERHPAAARSGHRARRSRAPPRANRTIADQCSRTASSSASKGNARPSAGEDVDGKCGGAGGRRRFQCILLNLVIAAGSAIRNRL